VALLDLHTGARHGHRAAERFPMCSTFKLLLAAQVLARADAGQERLDRRIRFAASDLVAYSPSTQPRAGDSAGMSVAELCEAAVTLSDNTAANLLLASAGGPLQWTAYARSLGDGVTRLDRVEPALNEATPGDPRDTTTPDAMLGNLRRLLAGDALSADARARLTGWLVANRTGARRLRAGLPPGWRAGEKTGSGEHGSSNDAGLFWPPGRAPVLVAAYLTESALPADGRDAVLAEVGRIAVGLVGG
jgi:beta-lactamase class A